MAKSEQEKLSNKLAMLHESGDVGMYVCGYAEEADTLEQRIDQLEQRNAELVQALNDDAAAKIMLEKLAVENGQLDIRMSGNIFHIFCEAFVNTFKETGAENYLTTEFHSTELGAFTVTMQRSQGLTVYQKLAESEQRNQELLATVERLLELTDRCECNNESCRECSIHKEACLICENQIQNLAEHDKELLSRFTKYLNERCDLHVQNMVRPFLDKDGE